MKSKAIELGIELNLKYIPREVFDKQAVDNNQVEFYDISYIDAKPVINKHEEPNKFLLAIELKNFSVYYNQEIVSNLENKLRKGQKKIVVINGSIYRIVKNNNSEIEKELLTKSYLDWIDYWAVDFNFESKKEFITYRKNNSIIKEETGSYIFENEWQSFRTKKDNTIETISSERTCIGGRRKIAVKVVDIFGNDSIKVLDVDVKVNEK